MISSDDNRSNFNPLGLINVINCLLPSPIPKLQALKPDRPASTYIINKTQYQHSLLQKHLQQSQKQYLIQTITQLQHQLHQHQIKIQSREQQHYSSILMLKLQIQRVRTIMREQGETIQRQSKEINQIETIYRLRFQQMKQEIVREFEQELANRQSESLTLIQQHRQLYLQKISTLTKSYQSQLEQKQQQLYQNNINNVDLKVYQIKQTNLNDEIAQLQTKNTLLQTKIYTIKQNLQQKQRLYLNQIDTNQMKERQHKLKYTRCEEKNQQLQQQLQQMNILVEELQSQQRQKIKQLQTNIQEKHQEVQLLKWKCHRLEQQLDQFKNRKTQQQLQGNNLIMGSNNIHVGIGGNIHANMGNNMHLQGNTNNKKYFAQKGEHEHQRIPDINNQSFQNHHPKYPDRDRQDTEERISYQHPRFQTQSRISYQQSLKKVYEMQQKLQHFQIELKNKNAQKQFLQKKVDELKDEIQSKILDVQRLNDSLQEKELLIKSMSVNNLTKNVLKYEAKISDKVNNEDRPQRWQYEEVKQQLEILRVENQQLQKQLVQKRQLLRQKQRAFREKQNQVKQKQKIIQSLDEKLQDSQNELKKMQKQTNNIKQALTQFQAVLEEKQAEINSKNEEIHQMKMYIDDIEYRIKQTQGIDTSKAQINLNEKLVNQKNIQINKKDQQIKLKDQQIDKLRQIQKLSKFKDKLINEKDDTIKKLKQELTVKENQLEMLKTIQTNKKHQQISPKNIQKNKNNITDQDNPFADPFIQQEQYELEIQQVFVKKQSQKETQTYNFDQNKKVKNNSNPTQLETKLIEYEHKIQQLQQIVRQLTVQWGTTQQNQNGIFTYIKSSYIDQIKTLKTKNQELQKNLLQNNQFVEIMAKKSAQFNQTMAASNKVDHKKHKK